MELMIGLRQRQSAAQEMREAFKIFDTDGDGYIDANDIRKTMRTLGEDVSEKDVKEMVQEADIDGDGRIDFKGMMMMMMTPQANNLFASIKEMFDGF